MCIYLMKNQQEHVAERFAQCIVGEVVMSSITYAELRLGMAVSANPQLEEKNLNELIEDIPVLAFDNSAANAYGPIRLATREKKNDALDKLIAAHAVALNAILVTNNVQDFARYPNLKIENWMNARLDQDK